MTEGVIADFARAALGDALERCWTLVRRLNRYVEESRPWELAKSEESADAERLDSVLYGLVEGLGTVTAHLVPFLPESSARLLDALGGREAKLEPFGSRPGGYPVETIEPLFPKVEPGGDTGA